jgi:putative FmdB family regulatory protein
MPLYDYRCTQCGRTLEVRHGFNESYNEPCPACNGALARVFNPAPIVFKGSGFYVNDSRKSSATTETKSESPKPETSTSEAPKADSKDSAA